MGGEHAAPRERDLHASDFKRGEHPSKDQKEGKPTDQNYKQKKTHERRGTQKRAGRKGHPGVEEKKLGGDIALGPLRQRIRIGSWTGQKKNGKV